MNRRRFLGFLMAAPAVPAAIMAAPAGAEAAGAAVHDPRYDTAAWRATRGARMSGTRQELAWAALGMLLMNRSPRARKTVMFQTDEGREAIFAQICHIAAFDETADLSKRLVIDCARWTIYDRLTGARLHAVVAPGFASTVTPAG
jgi:hypothetical protein